MTFPRGYRNLAGFDASAESPTWLYRIAVNRALQAPITEEIDVNRPGIQLPDAAAGPERLLLDKEIEHRRQTAMVTIAKFQTF